MGEQTQYIECDVVLDVSGPNERTVAVWTAKALRAIADRIEVSGYSEGEHPVTDGSGRPIGTVCIGFSEGWNTDVDEA